MEQLLFTSSYQNIKWCACQQCMYIFSSPADRLCMHDPTVTAVIHANKCALLFFFCPCILLPFMHFPLYSSPRSLSLVFFSGDFFSCSFFAFRCPSDDDHWKQSKSLIHIRWLFADWHCLRPTGDYWLYQIPPKSNRGPIYNFQPFS